MNCERCHKNHATYHLTAIENGVKREAHICEECARQSGVGFKFNFTIGELVGAPREEKAPKANQVRCPECGITYSEFKTKARLGCPHDYDIFRGELMRLLEKIHGSTTHVGKTPRTADDQVRKENELIRLKRDLESMVRSENFEKAAEIRDRIKTLETDLNKK